MDENIRQTMDTFASVWQRVRAGESPAPPSALPDEGALFRRFIRDAYCDALFYTSLARMFPSAGRSVLLAHAQECRMRWRLLRGEYFILSGEMENAKENCPSVGGKLASLRAIMQRELQQAELFRQTARSAASEPLRTLAMRFADEAELRARTDRTLLMDCF